MSVNFNRLRKRHAKEREDALKDIEKRRLAAYAEGFLFGVKVGKVFAASEFVPGVGFVSHLSKENLALSPVGSRSKPSKKS